MLGSKPLYRCQGSRRAHFVLQQTLTHLCVYMPAQMVQGLPLPLLKICDFGYSKAHFMSAPKSKVGTLAYMAPEIIKSTGNYDGKKADIWSCGVMMYVMLFGQYPFETQGPGQKLEAGTRIRTMMDRIVNMQWTIPAGVDISPECRDLLTRMLVRDPDRRITMSEIHQHVWFMANLPVEVGMCQ